MVKFIHNLHEYGFIAVEQLSTFLIIFPQWHSYIHAYYTLGLLIFKDIKFRGFSLSKKIHGINFEGLKIC